MNLFKQGFLSTFKVAGSLLIIIVFFIAIGVKIVSAGFGVSPPYVLAHNLLPGSYYEQVIYLVQRDPKVDLVASVKIEAEEIKDWISIDKGFSFTIPAGVQQFPIKIQLEVPPNAEYKEYKGFMDITTASANRKEGQVSISLGGRVDFNLKVTDEEVFGFKIKRIDIPDIEIGWPVKVVFDVKNTGNIDAKPTKLVLKVWSEYKERIISEGEFDQFETVRPFREKTLMAEIPADLPLGKYWGEYTIYKDDQVLRSDKIIFLVLPLGSIDKSLWAKTKILVGKIITWFSLVKIIVIIIALALIYVIYWARKNIKITRK